MSVYNGLSSQGEHNLYRFYRKFILWSFYRMRVALLSQIVLIMEITRKIFDTEVGHVQSTGDL